ncbi:MAG: PDZ domain-containing protein [Phycisphaeraceae bacterium]|nr:PDZ domain-containing protein [Phycisphaeraceae bacterium]
MRITLRTFRRSLPVACVLLAACASVAAQQGTASTAVAAGTAAPAAVAATPAPAQSTPPPASTPPAARPTPLPDGSFRDLAGNRLVPPAAMAGGKLEACPPALAKHLGLDPSKVSMLAEVIPGLPADKAGLEVHDLIIAVQGLPDAGEDTIRSAIRAAKPGDSMVVTARRGDRTFSATVVLEPWHPDHMIRPLMPHHFQTLPALPPPVPATTAQVTALEARVAALEAKVAELMRLMQAGH